MRRERQNGSVSLDIKSFSLFGYFVCFVSIALPLLSWLVDSLEEDTEIKDCTDMVNKLESSKETDCEDTLLTKVSRPTKREWRGRKLDPG